MRKTIRLNVPLLMSEKELNPTDIMRQAGVSYVTAFRLSKGKAQSISFDVLARLCELFDATPGEILVLEDAPVSQTMAEKPRKVKKRRG